MNVKVSPEISSQYQTSRHFVERSRIYLVFVGYRGIYGSDVGPTALYRTHVEELP